MSRTAKARRRARPSTAEPEIMKVRGPGDVVAMVPYLLGFQPRESLVVVALEGPRKRFGPVLRLDLAADPATQREQVAQVLDVLGRNAVARVLVAAFSDRPASADPLVRRLLDGLAARGVAVEDAFRADGQRWWSYVCQNPACCSPEGTPYEAASSRVAAEAVLAGMTATPDRDGLRKLFAPAPEERRREVAVMVALLRTTDPTLLPWLAAGELARRLPELLASDQDLSWEETAWLALAVQSYIGQNAVLGVVDRSTARRGFDIWRAVLSAVDDDLLPPVGCLAAFCAWLDGRGVLAWHAVERVFEVAPRHPFGRDLWAVLAYAVNPRVWDEGTRPDVRSSFAALAVGAGTDGSA